MFGFMAFNFIIMVAVVDSMYEWKRLRGYTVLGELLDQTTMASPEDCLYHCIALGDDCGAAQFVLTVSVYNCLTYKLLRDVILDPTICQFYLYDRRDIYPVPYYLSQVDGMLYSSTYMDKACPQGTIDNIENCILATTEEKCLEYNAFFKATYNGTYCIMALAQPRQEYYCVAKGVKSASYFNTTSKKCYFNVVVPANKTISYYDDQCKAVSPVSQLPTICDNQTNVFFQTFNENQPRLLGLYAPAGTKSLKWYDGNTCAFRGWSRPEYLVNYNTKGGETYIINSKFWVGASRIATNEQTCQETAYTLAEYWNNCETLDNCIQINKKVPSSLPKDEL